MMKLTEDEKRLYMETAETLTGKDRRVFMARVVTLLGKGGQRWAETEMGWNRGTIRRGLEELKSRSLLTEADVETRGRKGIENRLPRFLSDLEDIVRLHCRRDPEFWRSKMVTVSTSKIVADLVEEKGYQADELPSTETIRRKLKQMGYRLKR